MAVLLSTPSTSIPGIRSKAGRPDPAPPWGAGARYFSGLFLVRAPFSPAVDVAGSEITVDDVAQHGLGIGRPGVWIVDVIGIIPPLQREQERMPVVSVKRMSERLSKDGSRTI